jgi:hypothetical protein
MGNAAVIEALAKDPATACLNVNTIYGTLRMARTNITNGDVACGADGLTVKSQGNTSIPVTISPTVK